MEADLRKTSHGCAVKEEKRDDEEHRNGRYEEDNRLEDLPIIKDEEQLEITKAEMGEVREENQRLRLYLEQITKDYQTLQKQFQDILHQKQDAKRDSTASSTAIQKQHNNHQGVNDESELVSLSLGRTLSSEIGKKDEKVHTSTPPPAKSTEGLGLGLDCKFEISSTTQAESSVNPSNENSLEEAKEEGGETWPPQRAPTPKRSGEEQEISQQNPTKKTRVSVRVRCDTPTMNDGCQWRKYGQKIAKGNPCPRAYYRCTVSPTCPVRKQVQRCAQDMSVLITTYEGTHNHPLSMSATAMASTTSAAASMLTSGSSTSGSNPNQTANAPTTNSQGLNFYLTENSKLKPIYLPISPSPSCPTITLDLTSNTFSSSSPFNYRPSMPTTNFPPRYSTTNLNFSSLESSSLPLSWSNGALSYGKSQMGSLNFGSTQPQENLYQSFMQTKSMATPNVQNSLRPGAIEAATRAITSDPNFQSALQAALTSIIGGGSGGAGGGALGIHGSGGSFPVFSSFSSTPNANKCATSYLNKSMVTTTMNSQPQGPNSLPFSSSKSKSTSPESSRDQVI